MRRIKAHWLSWDPQPTWQEAVRIMVVEIVVCLAVIYALEAIF